MCSGSQQSPLNQVVSTHISNEQRWSVFKPEEREQRGATRAETEEKAKRGAEGGIMMKRRGMRGSKGKVTRRRRRRRRGGTSGTRGVGALYGVCKDHPSLPLLHSVVPDLERTRVLGGGGAVMVRATVYLQSMS